MEGWIKLHRKIIDSEIYQMPPLYLRVFERLIIEANHRDSVIPYNKGTKTIKQGERLTSVRQICRWVGWYERNLFYEPNPKTVQAVLDWLELKNMITIYGDKGNRKETLYNIVNYSVYQVEDVTKVTQGKQSADTNKNDKNIYILPSGNIYTSNSSDDESLLSDIFNFFNKNCKGLPEVKILSKKRKQSIRARIKEHGQEAVFAMLKKAGQSCFLAGQNKEGWIASFDWIFKPGNFIKVFEGNYDNNRHNSTKGSTNRQQGTTSKPTNMSFDQQRAYDDDQYSKFFTKDQGAGEV